MLRTAGNEITWLGHATVQITTADGRVILIDPWLEGNPSYPKTRKPIEHVDLILVTHGHHDHTGSVVSLAKEHAAPVLALNELANWFGTKGVSKILPMGQGGTQHVDGIDVTMVQAIHSSGVSEDEKAYVGMPTGLIIRLPGGFALYHAGDTCVFGDMKIIGELYKPDLVCLPIGDHYTMGPLEAAYAIRLLGALHVLPIHYGTFPQLTGTPAQLRALTTDIRGLTIYSPKPGESIENAAETAAH